MALQPAVFDIRSLVCRVAFARLVPLGRVVVWWVGWLVGSVVIHCRLARCSAPILLLIRRMFFVPLAEAD